MRLAALTATALAAVALAACGSDDKKEEKASGAEVNLKTFIFEPDPITVEAGTAVTWTNADGTDHDVTAGTRAEPTKAFGGKLGPSGGTYSTTFDKPGTYKYFCSLHSGEGMEGEVVVE